MIVSRSIEIARGVPAVEAAWYDVGRWASWVDGFGSLVAVREPWPLAGGEVVWESGPYGRGRVVERVLAYTPEAGQEVEVEDERLTGRQSVSFEPAGAVTHVRLSLDYRLKRGGVWMVVVDVLFIRRAVADSLRRTLEAFAREV